MGYDFHLQKARWMRILFFAISLDPRRGPLLETYDGKSLEVMTKQRLTATAAVS